MEAPKEESKTGGEAVSPTKQQDQSEPIQISWDMFVKQGELGRGAYGTVYKVRSLLSTRLGNDGAERVLISQKSLKKAAEQYATQKRKVGSLVAQGGKQLLKGEYYVIKEVDVDGLTE